MPTISGTPHTSVIGPVLLFKGTPQESNPELMNWGKPIQYENIGGTGCFQFSDLTAGEFYMVQYRIGPNKVTDFCFRPLKESHVIDLNRYEEYE